jgi:hypothetical protein
MPRRDFGSYTKTSPLTTACTGSSAPASSCTASPSGAVAIGLIVCTEGIVPHFRVGLGFDL